MAQIITDKLNLTPNELKVIMGWYFTAHHKSRCSNCNKHRNDLNFKFAAANECHFVKDKILTILKSSRTLHYNIHDELVKQCARCLKMKKAFEYKLDQHRNSAKSHLDAENDEACGNCLSMQEAYETSLRSHIETYKLHKFL